MALDDGIHLRATERFISVRSIDVEVKRTKQIETADGGTKRDADGTIPPQTIRVTELLRAQATERRTTEDGSTVIPTHLAVSMPDGDFQTTDEFVAYGERWRVVHVSRLPEWRLSMELISRGRE